MPKESKEVEFLPPEERAVEERLRREGGIMYEEIEDPESKEKKKYVNILGVRVETYTSPEDIEKIKKEIILSELDQRVLRKIAETYQLRQPLYLESDPGAGKTYLFKKFVQLVHGHEAPILSIIGSPRTSELDILGHWAPKGLSEKESQEYKEHLKGFLESDQGKKDSRDFNKKLGKLNERFNGGEIDQETFQEEFGGLSTEYVDKSRQSILDFLQLTKFLKPSVEWEFKKGALLEAYSGREGKGYPLLSDEFNLIPSNYQQIFLQIGGEKGELSSSISFWGNSGKAVYKRGKDTWICLAGNFPEKTPGRSEVVAPMTDRLVWEVLPGDLLEKKKKDIISTAGGRLKIKLELKEEYLKVVPEKKLDWAGALEGKIGKEVVGIVEDFDKDFIDAMEQVGDSVIIKGEKRRRTQQMEFSPRNPLRLFEYLDHFQVRNRKTGRIDVPETLRRAVKLYYIDRLADPELKKTMTQDLEEILKGETGKKEFEGRLQTKEEILNSLVEEIELTPEIKKQRQDEELEVLKKDILDNSRIPLKVRELIRKAKSGKDFFKALEFLKSTLKK